MATFRQTTSRADDPQIHTHPVISAKVQTPDGRWYALDARYLKRHQRMLGGLYQSVLRAELTAQFGVGWGRIVNGQAEIAGTPDELLAVFSKRTAAIDDALEVKVDDFRQREGREPSRWERAALTGSVGGHVGPQDREWGRRSGRRVGGGGGRCRLVRDGLVAELERVGAEVPATGVAVPISEIVGVLSSTRSSWGRADVVKALCDLQRPVPAMPGERWAVVVERATDRVLEQLVDLDPVGDGGSRRGSDGRSVWIEPTAARFTSTEVLAQKNTSCPGRCWPRPTTPPHRPRSRRLGWIRCRPPQPGRWPAGSGWR